MNSLESGANSPEIPIDEQVAIWTGFLISGTNNGRPIDFAALKADKIEIEKLREAVGASIGVEISPEAILRAIDSASIALQDRAIERPIE